MHDGDVKAVNRERAAWFEPKKLVININQRNVPSSYPQTFLAKFFIHHYKSVISLKRLWVVNSNVRIRESNTETRVSYSPMVIKCERAQVTQLEISSSAITSVRAKIRHATRPLNSNKRLMKWRQTAWRWVKYRQGQGQLFKNAKQPCLKFRLST